MAEVRKPLTPRQKYGEELRLRRLAAGMTQEQVSEGVVCSPTLISHYEAGRRLPSPDDAQRLDIVLGTDGFFARWLQDLDSKYAVHFATVADMERQATEIRHYGASLIPGLLQSEAYAREVFSAYRANPQAEEVDQRVVNRMERAQILNGPSGPVVWSLLDEAALRRRVGGARVMAEQLTKIADVAETGRVRLHVMTFGVGAHSLLEGMLYMMGFDDAPPIAYIEGLYTGHVVDDPVMMRDCRSAYDLAMSDALSHAESLALVRAVAKEYENEQQ